MSEPVDLHQVSSYIRRRFSGIGELSTDMLQVWGEIWKRREAGAKQLVTYTESPTDALLLQIVDVFRYQHTDNKNSKVLLVTPSDQETAELETAFMAAQAVWPDVAFTTYEELWKTYTNINPYRYEYIVFNRLYMVRELARVKKFLRYFQPRFQLAIAEDAITANRLYGFFGNTLSPQGKMIPLLPADTGVQKLKKFSSKPEPFSDMTAKRVLWQSQMAPQWFIDRATHNHPYQGITEAQYQHMLNIAPQDLPLDRVTIRRVTEELLHTSRQLVVKMCKQLDITPKGYNLFYNSNPIPTITYDELDQLRQALSQKRVPPPGTISLVDLAAELNIAYMALRGHVRYHKIPMSKYIINGNSRSYVTLSEAYNIERYYTNKNQKTTDIIAALRAGQSIASIAYQYKVSTNKVLHIKKSRQQP